MRRLFLILLVWLALFSAQVFAAVHHIAQTGAGLEDGSSAANARSRTWAVTSGNWSATPGTANKISPGDTVTFWGTWTQNFTVQGSGTEGNPITFNFGDESSKFSAGTWGATTSAAFYATNKDYLVIDGGDNSVVRIEATTNGEGLATQENSAGVRLESGCDHIEIRNLRVEGMYRRTYNGTDTLNYGVGILIEADTDALIENCYVSDANAGIYMKGNTVGSTLLRVKNNEVQSCSNGIFFACKSAGNTIIGGEVSGNRIDGCGNWGGGEGGAHHHNDGIQTISSATGCLITNLHIFNNHLGPNWGTNGHTTSAIFLEDNVKACYVYNNLVTSDTNHYASNAYIQNSYVNWVDGDPFGLIANNTIIATKGQAIAGGRAHIVGNIAISAPDATFMNIATAADEVGMAVDFNVYRTTSGVLDHSFYDGLTYNSLTSWRAAKPHDDNSVTTDPMVNADGTLQEGSSAIDLLAGLSTEVQDFIAAIYTTDYNGNARTGSWDAGAFEYGATTPTTGGKRTRIGGKEIRIGGKVLKIGDN